MLMIICTPQQGFSVFKASLAIAAVLSTAACQLHRQPPVPAAPVTTDVVNARADFSAAAKVLRLEDRPLKSATIIDSWLAENAAAGPVAAQLYATLGVEALMEKVYWKGQPKRKPGSPYSGEFVAVEALGAIALAAKTRRVVILNEDHTYQRHRAFAHLLAAELRAVGFTHLGLEALAPGSAEGVRRDGMKLTDSFYGADPFFADFVRQSQRMGYTVFDYEQRIEQEPPSGSGRAVELAARELSQAENIAAVLRENPDTKLFLYVGGSHGEKLTLASGLEMMARQLERIAGIEVLSVDQQIGTPISLGDYENPRHQAVQHLLLDGRSTLLRTPDGKAFGTAAYDMTVFHPRLSDIDGRAGWSEMNGYRKRERVNLPPANARTLLRAHAHPRRSGDVALDQVLVESGEKGATLFLPVGEYVLSREHESGVSDELGRVIVR